ncbi:ATP-grasp domain-containing protein [Corallococcus sicarius]|uniref:ATP-dependent carboxylate-amine ligase n=1 Tax=Corallococcus sicarius TaxID=2316726 RepID=A0A3A8N0H0_9BACT|nr:ATP-dependent carboxylate-amine ligase [Corallococcus sicarius]RKH32674.1 ATP-dependent carboxylate-amine ligase [Corallococcus sicarius]
MNPEGAPAPHPTRHVLVLANTDHEDTPYDEWAAGSDLQLTLLCSEEKAPGYRHLPRVWSFPNYRTNGQVEQTALRLAKEIGFCALFAKGEVDILRAGRLRDALGIPGQGFQSALAFRDKLLMKARLQEGGVPVAAAARVTTACDLLEFVEAHGLPVVIKPVLGSGSLDTRVIHDEAELDALLVRGIAPDMAVEKFVEGTMYHVDGLMAHSEVVEIHPSTYVNDCLSFQRDEFLGGYLLRETHPLKERLIRFTRQALRALPTPPHMTFHAEIWHTPDDRLVFCEIASRTAGCRFNTTFELGRGFNLDRNWFNAQCGLPVDVPPARSPGADGRMSGWCVVYPRAGLLTGLPSGTPPPGVHQLRLNGKPGQTHHGGYKSGDYLAGFILKGESEEQLQSRIREAATWFESNTTWRQEQP